MRMFGLKPDREARSTRRISAMPGRKTKRLPCPAQASVGLIVGQPYRDGRRAAGPDTVFPQRSAVAGDHRRLAQEIRDCPQSNVADITSRRRSGEIRCDSRQRVSHIACRPVVEFIEEDDRVSAGAQGRAEQGLRMPLTTQFWSWPHLRVESHRSRPFR
jgi:hypothetical protein